MSLFKQILKDTALILLSGAIVLMIACLLTPRHYFGKIPITLIYIAGVFVYACTSPGIIIPFVFMKLKFKENRSGGITLPVIAGVIYSILFVLVTTMGAGSRHFESLRLVETIHGWGILTIGTLGPGFMISYLIFKVSALTGRDKKEKSPDDKEVKEKTE